MATTAIVFFACFVETSVYGADTYRFAKLRPVPRQAVTIDKGFWKPIRDRSRDTGVPDYLRKFEEHGYINNFRYVAGGENAKHHGGPNNNEFVYKHLEAMGYYAAEGDRIARLHKDLSDTILAAQRPDGYLNTFYDNPLQKKRGLKRFQRRNRFEFYNFGHFTQAAIAHYRSTGDDRLLKAAIRFADLIVELFADPGDLPYDTYQGPVNKKYEHPNHELAMVELYRVTKDKRYLDFVRQTLQEYEFFGPKFDEIWGHAVQETLLYCGATDLYLETGQEELWQVIQRLWNDMHDRKLYIIGGIGSTSHGEAYGKPFELPNETAYCETCAAISLVFWNHKMLLATGEVKYADEMARSLYNNVLSGIALSGTEYFYRNPLRFNPKQPSRSTLRSDWFGCSCCPPNVHRLLATLDQYIYTATDSHIGVHLYTGSTLSHTLAEDVKLILTQTTEYPWQGNVEIGIGLNKPARFTLSLRVPAWCHGASAEVNGRSVEVRPSGGYYLEIARDWASGDVVKLTLPMPSRIVPGNPKVKDQIGRLALMRGPLVYCLEAHDNPGLDPHKVVVRKDVKLTAQYEPDLLGGVVTLSGEAWKLAANGQLEKATIKAIPYYAWANRGSCEMDVWLVFDTAVLSKLHRVNVLSRGSFANSRIQFEKTGKGHVAFIGGSITQMEGYRPMVSRLLQSRFPNTEFTFTDAGISSTCSTTGAFRLTRDVLSKGPVDLLFIEFAVNDDQDAAHARRDCIRGMEGIIRQARRHNPDMDIVVTYFVNPGMIETIKAGKTPVSIAAHEEVLQHYNVSAIHLAKAVTEQIQAGKLTWERFGGVHPKPFGNAFCTGMIKRLLEAAWSGPLADGAKKRPHPIPAKPLDPNSYTSGRFLDPKHANVVQGWKLHVPNWSSLPGGFRSQFAGIPLLCANEPGAEASLSFSGKAIGAYILAGPDAGIAEASIDGGPPKKIDLYHRFSRGLHYPRTVMFYADLKPGKHTLKLRMSGERNPKSKGHAMRILQFTVN